MKEKLIVRQATLDDLDEMLRVELESWGDSKPTANMEQLRARLEVYPDGQFVGILDGKMVGICNSMLLENYTLDTPMPTWNDVTANGYLKGKHSDKGDVVYGLNISVTPNSPPLAGLQILVGLASMAVERGMRMIIAASRMPGYADVKDKYTPDEYIRLKDERGRNLDGHLRFYSNIVGLKIVRPLPNYMPDPPSCDYGVLIAWTNFFRPFPKFTHKHLARLVRFLV